MPIVDRKTGEIREAELFLGVLGASSYTYAEATWTQTLPDWIGSHDADAMLLPKPLHQINEPPAHDTIEIGNRTLLNGLDKRLALFVVQQGLPALRLSGLQTIGTVL